MLSDFFSAFRKGQELVNTETWKNRTILLNALVAFIAALASIAKGFGYDVPVDSQALGSGVVAVVALVNGVMQIVTSKRVGLPVKG
jgi:hypothetical protein